MRGKGPLELGIKKIVVVSETSRSALKDLNILRGTEIRLIVVAHYPVRPRAPRATSLWGLRGRLEGTLRDMASL